MLFRSPQTPLVLIAKSQSNVIMSSQNIHSIKLSTKVINPELLNEAMDVLIYAILTQRIPELEDTSTETKSPSLHLKYVIYSDLVPGSRKRLSRENRES